MTTIYNVPAKFPIRGMIELDKTPLTQDDLDWAHDYDLMDEKNVHPAVKVSVIQTRRLLGVVEGLKEEWCICHHLYDDEKCSTCNKINEFFGVLK